MTPNKVKEFLIWLHWFDTTQRTTPKKKQKDDTNDKDQ